jgi:hypothetical protein
MLEVAFSALSESTALTVEALPAYAEEHLVALTLQRRSAL